MVLVVLFFVVNVSNNLAFAFNISMPLHMIFRSVSLEGGGGAGAEAGGDGEAGGVGRDRTGCG